MRYSITTVFVATWLVAIVLYTPVGELVLPPIDSAWERLTNGEWFYPFVMGVAKSLRDATFRDSNEMVEIYQELEAKGQESNYHAGQVVGWTLLMLTTWAIAFCLIRGDVVSTLAARIRSFLSTGRSSQSTISRREGIETRNQPSGRNRACPPSATR